MRRLLLLSLVLMIGCMSVSKGEDMVVFETTSGTIEIKLMPEVAPKACENFIRLIEDGYYDGIIFIVL